MIRFWCLAGLLSAAALDGQTVSGSISGTVVSARAPRQIQFSLRYVF